ncbi:ASCH domain-containing protein [Arthrobacter sp.]|uniref:ASCH domain-containing protein n=1 Tax=Arthrobacter sp. TaxID=1667 RepID=UPI00281200F9|nr:ASCH domain-containing protein [Arthrobacter sp.]
MASGQKTSTVRWDEQISVGPVLFYFEDDEAHSPLHGQILEVQRYHLDDLTAERLRLSEGERVDSYIESLRKHYPLMPGDALVDVVDFKVAPSDLGS